MARREQADIQKFKRECLELDDNSDNSTGSWAARTKGSFIAGRTGVASEQAQIDGFDTVVNHFVVISLRFPQMQALMEEQEFEATCRLDRI